MLDCVLVMVAFNSFQQVRADVFLDHAVTESLIEAQVGEISTALSVVTQVFRVLQHVEHEVDGLVTRDIRVAIQNFGDVGEGSGRVEGCLGVAVGAA